MAPWLADAKDKDKARTSPARADLGACWAACFFLAMSAAAAREENGECGNTATTSLQHCNTAAPAREAIMIDPAKTERIKVGRGAGQPAGRRMVGGSCSSRALRARTRADKHDGVALPPTPAKSTQRGLARHGTARRCSRWPNCRSVRVGVAAWPVWAAQHRSQHPPPADRHRLLLPLRCPTLHAEPCCHPPPPPPRPPAGDYGEDVARLQREVHAQV